MSKLKRPYDKITNEYVEKQLQKLMEEQEAYRNSMGLGGNMNIENGSEDFGPMEYKKGGWIQKAINPAHKGYCTPMTKSTCTPHRKALAKTFKKHHGFHADGGNLIKYDNGGPFAMNFVNPEKEDITPYIGPYSLTTYNRMYGNSPELTYAVPIQSSQINYSQPQITYKSLPAVQATLGDIDPDAARLAQLDKADKNKNKNSQFYEQLGSAGVLGAQLAGDVAGLAYSLKKPNYAHYQRVAPGLVNYTPAVQDVQNSLGLLENTTAKALGNQGQSSGAYLNERINLASRLGQEGASKIAQLRMEEANKNALSRAEAQSKNADIQRMETETNAREKDAKWQALVGHLGGIGSKVAGYAKDRNMQKLDEQQFQTLVKLYPSLFKSSNIIKNSDGTYTILEK